MEPRQTTHTQQPVSDSGWGPDILGDGFSQRTLEFAESAGQSAYPLGARATLVKYDPQLDPEFTPAQPPGGSVQAPGGAGLPPGGSVQAPGSAVQPPGSPGLAGHLAVLYVHGWNDYFYHRRLARMWAGIGAKFYAIDLRNYGRSLDFDDPDATPGLVSDLAEYGAEFDAALEIMRAEAPDRLPVFHAHSTGGLSTALWVNDNPDRVHGLLLNSPWLEFQMDAAVRKILTPWMKTEIDFAKWQLQLRKSAEGPRFEPLKVKLPNYYTLAVAQAHGKLPFDPKLKPVQSFPVYPQFLSAVFAGHQRVADGLDLQVPVLMQTSKASTIGKYGPNKYVPEMASTDIVLDVEILAQRALKLADQVVVDRIPGAMHDIFLSTDEVAQEAFARIVKFVRGYLPRPD